MAQQEMSDEQLKALQERIKNMSPEELRDFQKKQCIFCQIIAGKIQAKKIYEDDKSLGILDINPANPGHVLLLPKEHYSIMPQVPEDELAHIFIIAKQLSNSMLRGIEAQGTNIIVANGVAAGQRAQHFMVHIIPRKENDGVDFLLPQKTLPQEIIEQVGDKIISSLGGKSEKEPVRASMRNEQKKEDKKTEHKTETKQVQIKPESKEDEPDFDKNNDDDEIQTPKSNEHSKKEAKNGIDLDDIAKLLGAK